MEPAEKGRDIPGRLSCGLVAFMVVAWLAIYVWVLVDEGSGHPSDPVAAAILLMMAVPVVSLTGLVLGAVGYGMHRRAARAGTPWLSLLGGLGNLVGLALGLHFYWSFII